MIHFKKLKNITKLAMANARLLTFQCSR